MEDEWLIHKLVASYVDAVNRQDVGDIVGLFADDASIYFEHLDVLYGQVAIHAFYRDILAQMDWTFQAIHSGVARTDGDHGWGRFWISEQSVSKSGQGLHFFGAYEDRYVRTPRGWRFGERRLVMTYLNDAAQLPGNRPGDRKFATPPWQ